MEPPEWRTEQTTALFEGILKLRNIEECERFFRDLLSDRELRDIPQRFYIAKLHDEGLSKSQIAKETGAAHPTIDRVLTWFRLGTGGFKIVLDRMKGQDIVSED